MKRRNTCTWSSLLLLAYFVVQPVSAQWVRNGLIITPDTTGAKVSIGTTTPSYILDIGGDLRAELIVVEVASGADYVFADDYDLRPLDEVARYVRQHRHLPGVAPAAEMEAEGVEVGALQMTLLEKVEELTLYLIELHQENEALKARVAALEQQ